MNTKKKTLTAGILLLISGIIAAMTSHEPSGILQYIFAATLLAAGILGVLIHTALLFMGVLFVLAGLSFMKISQLTKETNLARY